MTSFSHRRLIAARTAAAVAALGCLAGGLTGCGGPAAPDAAPTPFAPDLGPAGTQAARHGARAADQRGAASASHDGRRGRARGAGPGRSTPPTAAPGPSAVGTTGGASTASGPSSPSVPSAPSAGTAARSAAVSDVTGDPSGYSVPAWADVTAGRVTRTASGWRVEIDLAAAPPSIDDDRVLGLSIWVDHDGDGSTDDEALAQLSSSGWTTAYRSPDGARYGADSGVRVDPQGAHVALTLPATSFAGRDAFRWAVGAQLGSPTQISAGTTSRDLAPDRGGAAFPG